MSNIWDDNLHLQDILFSFILSLYLSSLSLLVHWTLLLLFCSFAPLWSTTLLYVLVSYMYCTVLCSLHTCNFTFCQWTPLLLFALVLYLSSLLSCIFYVMHCSLFCSFCSNSLFAFLNHLLFFFVCHMSFYLNIHWYFYLTTLFFLSLLPIL